MNSWLPPAPGARHDTCVFRNLTDLARQHFTKQIGRGDLPLTQAVLRARPSVAWTQLPDGAVLFSPESEVYYAVNQAGALIWEMLADEGGERDIDSLCLAVQTRFPDASPQQIRNDVADILRDFAENDLLATAERKHVA